MDLAGLIGGFIEGAIDYYVGLFWGLISAVAPFAVVIGLICVVVFAIVGAKKDKTKSSPGSVGLQVDPSGGLDEQYWQAVRSAFLQDEARRYDGMLASVSELEHESKRFVAQQNEASAKRVVQQARKLHALVESEQNRLSGRAEYRRYLALHYASFTAANGIHEAREQMKAIRDREAETRQRLGKEIARLKDLQKHGARNGKQIADSCRIHKRTCILTTIYADSAKELYSLELAQNEQTKELREYIGSHFGAPGRSWYRRLMKRKMAARSK